MIRKIFIVLCILILPAMALAANNSGTEIDFFGIPLEFIFFGLTLVGVAIFHHHTLLVAITGLISILILKIGFLDYSIAHHVEQEWPILLNLFLLLLGFSILSRMFEDSHIPKILPKFLPDDWKGPFLLLIMVFILSSFLDNIAAALIGGSIAHVVFRGKVHIGYLAGIVAASNAGGSGSVIGDTTTTMMWIDGVAPGDVLHAYVAAVPALLFFGYIAAHQQHRYHPILKGAYHMPKIEYKNLLVCIFILSGAILANIYFDFPSAGVWIGIILGTFLTRISWEELQKAVPGSVFLISLVFSASMMPVEKLPEASWGSALTLGFISAVFDNIPLTKLALEQGGFDWGMLAYAVGFGGSMIWFGSSAGVAISNMYPEAKSVGSWVKNGWHVAVAYIIGFAVLLGVLGWHPHAPHREEHMQPVEEIGIQTNAVNGSTPTVAEQ